MSIVRRLAWQLGALGLCFGLMIAVAPRAIAQTGTGSVAGFVTDSAHQPLAGAAVTLRDLSTNITRSTTTSGKGFYYLGGLRPGSYEAKVAHIGSQPATRQVRVFVGDQAKLDFALVSSTITLQEVVVRTAPPPPQTSEVATNVTEEQLRQLPSPSRNFLDLAGLAPSVNITPDRISGTAKTFQAGAQPSSNINVFVDGQSYKNDLTNVGGVAGQDASRGNPFPRNAVQEYRIITNSYKAEYQKASSGIITAATRSGTNVWQGSIFTDYQNQGFVALDSFQRADKANNPSFAKPDYSRVLAGGSVGGPIVHDKLFLFGSYEGNFQNRQGVTRFNGDPANWPAAVQAVNGEVHTAPFRSSLAFAKLNWNATDNQQLELSGNLRSERDQRSFGGQFAGPDRAFSAGENFRNNVYDAQLKHSYFGDKWLNEAAVSWQYFQFNPEPFNFTAPGLQYNGIGRLGGNDSRQDLTQKHLVFRDDWTYSGLQWAGAHVVKVGGIFDLARYSLNKQLNENPVFIYDARNNYQFPIQAQYGFGNGLVKGNNNQLGFYAQDDWSPSSRLVINAGIRWDYESGMYDMNYVTPQAVIDSLTAYRSQLYVNIDPNRYFTNGTQRKAFKGAFQPRLGFSYALDESQNTTVFGAAGIFYDRFGFNNFIDETYRRQHPNYTFNFGTTNSADTLAWDPSLMSRQGLDSVIAAGKAPPQEVFLVPNDLKPPKSYQFTGGLRHAFGRIKTSIAYTGVRSKNGFSYEWANVTLNPATNDCCLTNNLPAYQNILVGNNSVRTWYDAVEVKVDRPYARPEDSNWGWGAGLAYTLSWADQEGGDLFSFPQVTIGPNARHPTSFDQRHRVTANFVTDLPFLYGIQFSGLITLSSGSPFNKISFANGQRTFLGQAYPDRKFFIVPNAFAYRNVDLRLRKDFPQFAGTRLGVTADLFNAFNFQNLGCFNETYQNGDGSLNPDFGKAGCVISDPRRFQIGFQYDF